MYPAPCRNGAEKSQGYPQLSGWFEWRLICCCCCSPPSFSRKSLRFISFYFHSTSFVYAVYLHKISGTLVEYKLSEKSSFNLSGSFLGITLLLQQHLHVSYGSRDTCRLIFILHRRII